AVEDADAGRAPGAPADGARQGGGPRRPPRPRPGGRGRPPGVAAPHALHHAGALHLHVGSPDCAQRPARAPGAQSPAPAARRRPLATGSWMMSWSGQLQSDRYVRAEPTLKTGSQPRRRARPGQPTGHVRLALVLLERAPQLGVARETLLADAKLDEKQLGDPSGRIPLAAVACLWRSLASHVSNPAIGLRVGADI